MATAMDLKLTGVRELSERMTVEDLIEYLAFHKLKRDAEDKARLQSETQRGLEQAKARPR